MSNNLVQARSSDATIVGRVTASAFRRDPFNRWLFDGVKLRSYLFKLYARDVYIPNGICDLAVSDADTDQVVGATQWLHSSQPRRLSVWSMLKLAFRVLLSKGPLVLARLIKVDAVMKSHHPKESHVYLFTVGVLDEARGSGKGRDLLRNVLDDCDEKSLPVYLENSNPRNHDYYKSYGFNTLKVINPIKNSPPLELMWREPMI